MKILVQRKKARTTGKVTQRNEYAIRIGKVVGGELEGRNALLTLQRTLNAKQRWVRYKPEDLMQWTFTYDLGVTGTYMALSPTGTQETVHVYYQPENNAYFFSVRVTRREHSDIVLPDWHVNTCKNLAREGYEYTQAFSDIIFEIGTLMALSIRNREGIWRK